MMSVETFTSLVEGVYEAGLDAPRWPEVLAQVAAVSGGRVAGLIDSGAAQITVFSAGVDHAADNAYNKHYYRLDPIAGAVGTETSGHARQSSGRRFQDVVQAHRVL